MDFWLVIFFIVGVIVGFPYFRCFVKRIVCAAKLARFCKKKNYTLHKTHALYFFGHKYSEKCDFYIETSDSIYAVKLFGVPRRSSILVLKENGEYYVRNYIYFMSFVHFELNGKPKPVPQYNFRYHYKDEWEIKTPHQILLVHPVSMEIRLQKNFGGEVIVGAGDIVNGMKIQSLSRFLGEL